MMNNLSEKEAVSYLNASGVETHYSLLHRLHNLHRAFKHYLKYRSMK